MWNSNPGFPGSNNPPYPPPGGYGEAPSFPSPGGFGPPPTNTPPYQPGYAPSYPPPHGPPPTGFPNPGGFPGQHPPSSTSPFQVPSPGFQPPSGPPPGSYPSPVGPPPTQGHYQQPPGPPSQYQPPPGPPSQYQPPPGPPSQYRPHSGPPPTQSQQWKPSSSPLPQQGQQGPHSFNQNSGGYPGSSPFNPPPGPPTPSQGPPSIPGNRPLSSPNNAAPHMPTFERQFVGSQGNQFSYQNSMCNGKKKALCIGVNYRGQQAELKGCINDALHVKRFLCSTYGYKDEDIVTLTDDARNPRQMPTRSNMLDAMRWLVRDAKPNDSLFFHFSGHGGQTKDHDGDEQDGYDEVIYPLDFKTAGHIVDDLMHDIMVKPLPPGCRLTCIFDCCHSGSSLDLPYMYSTEGKIKEPNVAADIGQGLLGIASSYAKKDMGGLLKGGLGVLRAASGGAQKAGEYAKKTRTSPADVISWSGCKDSQTSADTFEAGKATGAMSFAFISVLSQNKNQTYQSLLNNIRDVLKSKYSQKPQLAASHPIDTNAYFIC